MRMIFSMSALILLMLMAPNLASSQSPAIPPWIADFGGHHLVFSNLPYKRVGDRDLKLDVYQRTNIAGPAPTVFYIHGGGWVHGSPVWELRNMLPWMAMGWSVVSIEYRLLGEAPAPAAIQDCRSALRWVAENASKYHFDLTRLVIFGTSAGGELAFMTAMAPPSAEFDGESADRPLPKAAAIVNFSGAIDVEELLRESPVRGNVADWVAASADLARRVSPINYIRPGLPPIFTNNGDKDPIYPQAVRFHQALTQAGVPNQLYTVRRGGHGGYSHEQNIELFNALRGFLDRYHLNAAE